jgi:hypothetical protein
MAFQLDWLINNVGSGSGGDMLEYSPGRLLHLRLPYTSLERLVKQNIPGIYVFIPKNHLSLNY